MGAWIEIITSSFGILRAHGSLPSWERGLKCYDRHQYPPLSWSLPSWERGLKFEIDKICIRIELVAPLVGAWIEIVLSKGESSPGEVAPLVGAWIEILVYITAIDPQLKSLPSWERGLKYVMVYPATRIQTSLPSWERGLKFGTSIEYFMTRTCRSPRGSVD